MASAPAGRHADEPVVCKSVQQRDGGAVLDAKLQCYCCTGLLLTVELYAECPITASHLGD